MPIDAHLLRSKTGLQTLRESQHKRNGQTGVTLVDEVVELDAAWIAARFRSDEANRSLNATEGQIRKHIKAGHERVGAKWEALKSSKDALVKEKTDAECAAKIAEEILLAKKNRLGNLVHNNVIHSGDEAENGILNKWWPQGRTEAAELAQKSVSLEDPGTPGSYGHHQLLHRIGGYDAARGQKVAGHRGYFLTGPGVDLNYALIQYGLDFLQDRGYTKISTPFMMNQTLMAQTAQLEEFDEALYKVSASEKEGNAETDCKYLIATSEQPLSAFHAGEWFQRDSDLPVRYAGISTCFRKEAGAHGRDTWGLFRIHQFEKVEQFVLAHPDLSWAVFDEMIATSEAFYQSLGLPYRTVSIVSGALNNAASKKVDLEAWFPFHADYKELVSCSNCTDYQTRALNISFGPKLKSNGGRRSYVHALNATLCATERTLCCILENWQTTTGVTVPDVLRPYMRGRDFLPFVQE